MAIGADTADARHGAGTLGAGYCFMDSPGDDLESISLDGL